MQIVPLKFGSAELVFPPSNTVRIPFQFGAPAASAYALLRGLRWERTGPETYYSPGPDTELKALEISLLPLFDALQSNVSGQVQIEYSFPGDVSPDMIHLEIEMLVIGV